MADQELVVKFKGDTSDLERAFARAGQLADKYSGTTGSATSATQKFDRAGGDLNNTFGNMVKGYLGLSAVMQGGQMFIDATAKVQKYENQLKVASGTQESYAKNTSFLEGLAEKYNKNVLELGKSYAQLTIATRGTNLEGEKADRLFAAVTATSSALQMSVDETNGTFQAFIQMVSKGNVQAEELRGQLGERLYGAFNLAAKAMGVSTAELNKMLENGQVLASDLLPKLTIELEKSFGSQAEKNAHNLGSAIDYATGQITLFFAELGKSSGLTGTLTTIAEKIGEIARNARDLGSIKPDKNSIWDMMFTLPGSSTGGISKLEGVMALVNAYRNPTGAEPPPDISERRNRRQGIDSTRKALEDSYNYANKLAQEAAEKKRKEAEAIVSKWASEQIQMSKDRIAEGILDAEIANNAKYRTHNSPIDTPGQILPTGTKNTYSLNGGEMRKTGQVFSNESTGDGSATNYDHIIANMSTAVDAAIAEQARLQKATQEFEESFDQSMKNALGNALANTAQGVGELVAGLATGTTDLEDVGNTFAAIIATLLRQIADALVAYAAVKLLANEAFKTGNPYVALAAAALAYGAAAVAESAINKSGEDAAGYWTGGIIDGPGGRDRVPIMATKGEIMMNGSQQNRLWNFLSGGSAPDHSAATGGRAAHGGDLTIKVVGGIKRGDIDFSGKQGARDNAYFGMRKR